MGFPLKTCSHVLPSAVGWIKFRPSCTVFSHGPMRNIGFLGRWGTYACLLALSLSEAGPRRFGRQVSVTDIYHTIPHPSIYTFRVCLQLSWTSTLLAVGITPPTTAGVLSTTTENTGFSKWSPRFTDGIYREAGLFLTTPFTEGCDGVNYPTLPPGRSNMLYF